jgi:hypothetical protein
MITFNVGEILLWSIPVSHYGACLAPGKHILESAFVIVVSFFLYIWDFLPSLSYFGIHLHYVDTLRTPWTEPCMRLLGLEKIPARIPQSISRSWRKWISPAFLLMLLSLWDINVHYLSAKTHKNQTLERNVRRVY